MTRLDRQGVEREEGVLVIIDAVIQVAVRNELLDLVPHGVDRAADGTLDRSNIHSVSRDLVTHARNVLHNLALETSQVAVHVASPSPASVVVRDSVVWIWSASAGRRAVCNSSSRLWEDAILAVRDERVGRAGHGEAKGERGVLKERQKWEHTGPRVAIR